MLQLMLMRLILAPRLSEQLETLERDVAAEKLLISTASTDDGCFYVHESPGPVQSSFNKGRR